MLLICATLANAVMGATVSVVAFGASPLTGSAVGMILPLLSPAMPTGILRAGVLTEVWTGELIKAFRPSKESMSWFDRIRSFDQYVNNDVIHFVEIGGDPAVLVNNTTYPLAITNLVDADKPITLDKFSTEATPVSDDELHALSYDKMQSVIERHRDAIQIAIWKKALHAIAPNNRSVSTTGETYTTGNITHNSICFADILAAKKLMDRAEVPQEGRILVLCSNHVNQLLQTEQKFREQYAINQADGKIGRLYGFDIYESNLTPYYNIANSKTPWGGVPDSTEDQASVFFHAPSMMKAGGSVKMYYQEAQTDPLYHRNLVNFERHAICLPLKASAVGSICCNRA